MTDAAAVEPKSETQTSLLLRVITVVALALSLFQLYSAGVQPLGLFYQRPIHLGFILVLCFLIYPIGGRGTERGLIGWLIDGPLILLSVVVGVWVPINLDTIANAIFPRQIDVAMGVSQRSSSLRRRAALSAQS